MPPSQRHEFYFYMRYDYTDPNQFDIHDNCAALLLFLCFMSLRRHVLSNRKTVTWNVHILGIAILVPGGGADSDMPKMVILPCHCWCIIPITPLFVQCPSVLHLLQGFLPTLLFFLGPKQLIFSIQVG